MPRIAHARRPVLGGTLAALVCLAVAGAPARAQDTDSATVRLIQLLIAKGILSKDQAASLLSQAQSEARGAPAAARSSRLAPARLAPAGAASLAGAEPPAPELPKGTVRVTYVPPIVRDQIAAQVREQVLGEEQKNGWAAPNALPDWTRRITVYGDIRLRGERVLQDPGNKATAGAGDSGFPFTNFDAINTGSPYDATTGLPPPQLNTTEDRTRYRIRARLGVKADVDDWISTDIRLATGNDNSPVTENQTLGQGTEFGKYSIWLDRAYALLKVPPRAKLDQLSTVQAYVGRFGNPFWTTDLEYSDDLNFDGAALQLVAPVARNTKLWATGGAFQVYNTDFNYGNSDALTGYASRDKYLFAGQVRVDYQAAPAIATKFAVGVFGYGNVEGKMSAPCDVSLAGTVCNTDNSRPAFQQFGNTVFPIRDIVPPANYNGTAPFAEPEYYGLASKFDVLDLHGRVQLTHYDPVDVEIEGEYSKNLAFNRADIIARNPQNNLGASSNPTAANPAPGGFVGGDTAWMLKLELGKPEITRLNEWNVYFGYKHLDSDSVLDAFTDSNFHNGGTNAKGFFVGAGYGIGKNTYLAARWYSANTVSGPKYGNDIVQIDLNSKF